MARARWKAGLGRNPYGSRGPSRKQLNETLQVTFALGGPEGERSRAAGGGESDRSGLFADAKAS